jgi:CSLREA domain-containing protein
MKLLIALSISILLTASLLTAASPVPLAPANNNLTVTTTADEYDSGDPGDDSCSLREAVTAAITNVAFGGCPAGSSTDYDIIKLSAETYTLTRAGYDDSNESGDLDFFDPDAAGPALYAPAVINDIMIDGMGSDLTIIDGNGIDRVIDVFGSMSLQITRLTIRDGHSLNQDKNGWGGGIYNAGVLNLNSVTITNNISGRDASTVTDKHGGGIYNSGRLLIAFATISNNQTHSGMGSGDFNGGDGGGIYNTDTGNIDAVEVTIRDNLTGDTFDSSTCACRGGHGGGIYNAGIFIIYDGTISGNRTGKSHASGPGGNGGGIYNTNIMNIRSSTLSSNVCGDNHDSESNGGSGGAIYNSTTGSFPGPIINTTISYNAAGNGSPDGEAGGIFNAADTTDITLHNTILALNTNPGNTSPECSGGIKSNDYNLIYDTSGCMINGTITHNIPAGQDPLLGILKNNRGYTTTHALLLNSPAIDTGDDTDCLSNDQRQAYRPIDGDLDGIAHCDIGAYEREQYFFLPLMFTP